MSPKPRRPAAPQARVLENDARILDAAVEILAAEGWSNLTLAAVAREAGLSNRPVQTRFRDRSALAARVWTDRLSPALVEALGELLDSTGALGEPASTVRARDALDALAHPDSTLLAGVELLVVAQFDRSLAKAVRSTLGSTIATWCTPVPGSLTRARAGQRSYLVSAGIGLVMISRLPGVDWSDLGSVAPSLIGAISANRRPAAQPRARAPFFEQSTTFHTGDEALDALLKAALEQVGTLGFEGSSTAGIAKAAGYSEGLLFGRYESKLALYLDATRRQHEQTVRANEAFMQSVALRHGRGIAEAVLIRESQRPELAFQRAVTTEQLRVSWHEPDLLAADARTLADFTAEMKASDPDWGRILGRDTVYFGYGLGMGMLLMAVAFPECWTLPYDVMTVPLTE